MSTPSYDEASSIISRQLTRRLELLLGRSADLSMRSRHIVGLTLMPDRARALQPYHQKATNVNCT